MFLKWGAKAFKNMLIVPPGSGIVHQVNLEYLARVVFDSNELLYPDSVVGTDSHTTMINGLGVLGWGVGGIEAEAVMLGQAITMIIPKVVGYKLVGVLNQYATSTDLVLTVTKVQFIFVINSRDNVYPRSDRDQTCVSHYFVRCTESSANRSC